MPDERSKPSEKREEKVSDLPERKASPDEAEQVKGGATKRLAVDGESKDIVHGGEIDILS